MRRILFLVPGLAAMLLLSTSAGEVKSARLPENLAPHARITATSEYGPDYRAKLVADAQIPEAASKQDVGLAWCVNGRTHKYGAEITFAWEKPVTVAEVIYYGRTAWFIEECWQGY